MDQHPPHYAAEAIEDILSARSDSAIYLQRVLLDHLAYTYDVSYILLHEALFNTPLASTYPRNGVASILTKKERDYTLYLAHVVQEALSKIKAQQHSAIAGSDLAFLLETVERPAEEIGVKASHIYTKLRYYAERRSHRSMRLFSHVRRPNTVKWYNPLTWLFWPDRNYLLEKLISDDMLIELIAPNEATRLLIGRAIANTGDTLDYEIVRTMGLHSYSRKWPTVYPSTLPRVLFETPSSILLSREARKIACMKQETAFGSLDTKGLEA